jgi:hypothetical protein
MRPISSTQVRSVLAISLFMGWPISLLMSWLGCFSLHRSLLGCLVFSLPGFLGAVALLVVANPETVPTNRPGPHPWFRRPYQFRRPEAGTWLDAPIAEVDKSTMGKLLASRMRREPGLHVVVRGRDATSEPIRSDALYDAELDG